MPSVDCGEPQQHCSLQNYNTIVPHTMHHMQRNPDYSMKSVRQRPFDLLCAFHFGIIGWSGRTCCMCTMGAGHTCICLCCLKFFSLFFVCLFSFYRLYIYCAAVMVIRFSGMYVGSNSNYHSAIVRWIVVQRDRSLSWMLW